MFPANFNQAPVQSPTFDAVAPFADPFIDLAAAVMPVSVPAMLRHAEFFGLADETLRAACNRMASYFLTDIQIDGELGNDEKKDQKSYLTNEMGLIPFCHDAGLSFLIYGNQYTSVLMPFIRYVSCPATLNSGPRSGRPCGARYRFAEFNAKENEKIFHCQWQSGISGKCPACGYSGIFHDKDRPPADEPDEGEPLILKYWNPHDIRPIYNGSTGQTEGFIWVIPAEDRTDAKMGYNNKYLENTPWEWLMAACGDQNIEFDTDFLHHWKEPTLHGVRSRGIGIPKAIINYRRLYYNRVVDRMNEVLAVGHIVPMRVISPANTTGRGDDTDILKVGFMGNVKGQVTRQIANWRADPSSVQFSPIPLQFQALGADARSLIPADITNQGQERLLNGLDVPVEFYRCNMTTQAAPVGLRLVEALWSPYVWGLNSLLRFVGRRAQFLLKWQKATYSFKRVTLVDSVEKNQLTVQMAQAGMSSRSRALEAVDQDFEEEVRQKLLDQRTEQRLQAEFDEENEAFQFGKQLAQGPQPGQPGQGGGDPNAQGGGGGDPSAQGGQPQGGAQQAAGTPPGSDPLASLLPQPGVKMDPAEYLSRAQQTAQYLLSVPESQRFGLLQRIKDSNAMFHQIVRGQMEQYRSKARSQGQAAVMQQQFGTPG